MSETYPPVSFYFELSFLGVIPMPEVAFKEVSGINMEMGVEEIAEGGVGYKHRVPTNVKFSNLILKRGLVPRASPVALWCTESINRGLENTIVTQTIVVSLLGESGLPLKSWSFFNAWPVNGLFRILIQ